MPIVSIPLMGGISFISKKKIEGAIVVILGITSICVIIYSTIKIVYSFNKAKEEIGNNYLADMVSDFINIEYSVPVLIIGLILVIIAAVIKDDEKNSKEKIVEVTPSDIE